MYVSTWASHFAFGYIKWGDWFWSKLCLHKYPVRRRAIIYNYDKQIDCERSSQIVRWLFCEGGASAVDDEDDLATFEQAPDRMLRAGRSDGDRFSSDEKYFCDDQSNYIHDISWPNLHIGTESHVPLHVDVLQRRHLLCQLHQRINREGKLVTVRDAHREIQN